MKIIGLTGGIGSGKSTVAQFLAEMGAVILDADKVGHEALQPGTVPWREVVAAFSEQIVAPDGGIDRERLGKIVFENPEALSRLNRILHPWIYGVVEAQLGEYRREGADVVVLEVPLLLEAGWTPLVDEVWVTVASESTVIRRLKERTGFSESESLARIRTQLPAGERIKRADVVINNDGNLDELKAKVKELWSGLQV